MPATTSNLMPRADVSTGALAGALVGLLMIFLTGSPSAAVVAPLLVVVLQFAVEYLVPTKKAEAGAIAGAVVVVGVGIYSLVAGLPLDEAAFVSAGTYLVTMVLTFALPAAQPGEAASRNR